MNLQAIQIFVHIVQEKGFSAAALKLGVPKQTVSRKLSILEQELGIRLLERSTRNIRMTEQGKRFYQYALQITNLAQQAKEEIRGSKEEPNGQLRISVPLALGDLFVRQVISEYISRYPKVSVDAKFTFETIDPMKDEIDVAFLIGPLTNSSLIAKKIMPSSWIKCVATPSFIEEFGPFESPQDLENIPFIFFDDHQRCQGNIVSFYKNGETQNITIQRKIYTNSIWLAKDALLKGIGFACLPSILCFQELKNNDLNVLLPQWQFPDNDVFAVYPSRKLMSSTIRSFLDLLDEFRAFIPNGKLKNKQPDIFIQEPSISFLNRTMPNKKILKQKKYSVENFDL